MKCQPVEFLDFVEDDLRHVHAFYDSWQHEGARRFQERFRETIDWAIEPKVTTVVAVTVASAHAIMSPAVAKANALQQFTLSVPTEESGQTTTKIELTVPSSQTGPGGAAVADVSRSLTYAQFGA